MPIFRAISVLKYFILIGAGGTTENQRVTEMWLSFLFFGLGNDTESSLWSGIMLTS